MSRHAVRNTGRGIRLFSASVAAAAVVGMMPVPTPTAMLEAQHSIAHRTVSADYVPLGVYQYQVPGTGSTVNNPPAGMPDMSYLDSGVWNRIPEGYALLDKKLYRATLESSGPNSGQNSVDGGADALVEEILKKDPNTTVVGGAGGSQGARVWAVALSRLAEMGYPMDNVFVVLYSDPGMPGTGILARYNPDEKVLTTGLNGGATELPEGGTYVRIVNAGDPMAFFPKDPWNLLAVLNAIAGFALEHGALANIDYANATITKEGNLTTVIARPYGDVVSLVAPLVMLNMPHQLVRFVNELVAPLVYAGGMYEEGHIQQNPSLESVLRQVVAIAEGIRNALTYAVRLVLHQPTPAVDRNPSGYDGSPADDLIDDMYDRDEELNGPSETVDTESTESGDAPFSPQAARATQPEQPVIDTPSPEGASEIVQQNVTQQQTNQLDDNSTLNEEQEESEETTRLNVLDKDDELESDNNSTLNEEQEESVRSNVNDEDDKEVKSGDQPSTVNQTAPPADKDNEGDPSNSTVG